MIHISRLFKINHVKKNHLTENLRHEEMQLNSKFLLLSLVVIMEDYDEKFLNETYNKDLN